MSEFQFFSRKPDHLVEGGGGTVRIWEELPIIATHVSGVGSIEVANGIDSVFRNCLDQTENLVAVHHWGGIKDIDMKTRPILRKLTKDVVGKQRELLIYLNPEKTFVSAAVQGVVKTINFFRKWDIEFFENEAKFISRALAIEKNWFKKVRSSFPPPY